MTRKTTSLGTLPSISLPPSSYIYIFFFVLPFMNYRGNKTPGNGLTKGTHRAGKRILAQDIGRFSIPQHHKRYTPPSREQVSLFVYTVICMLINNVLKGQDDINTNLFSFCFISFSLFTIFFFYGVKKKQQLTCCFCCFYIYKGCERSGHLY